MLDLDGELRLPRYVQKRCLQRLNFVKSIAGVWWGAHSLHDYVVQGPCALECSGLICYDWKGFSIEG
jgi:hypothetical protein